MIMQMANFRVGVPDMGGIRGVPGITGIEEAPLSIGLLGDRFQGLDRLIARAVRRIGSRVKNPNAPAVKREAEGESLLDGARLRRPRTICLSKPSQAMAGGHSGACDFMLTRTRYTHVH
jgi:hypothetical protein